MAVVLVVTDDTDDGRDDKASSRTDEEQVKQVVEEAMTRWGEAEAGDASACEGIGDLIDGGGEDVEAQCTEEVGSHETSSIESIEVGDVALDGDHGTAHVTFAGTEDGEDAGFERDIDVVKVDGQWKVAFD